MTPIPHRDRSAPEPPASTLVDVISPHTGRLMRTAASLMSSTVVTAVLGLVFWAVAARLYSVQQVGIDGALITAMVTLSTVSQLNLTNTIVRFLPTARRIGLRIAQAYASAVGVSLGSGIVFVIVAPAVSGRYHFLSADGWLAIGFVIALAAWTVFTLQDAVLVALGRAPWLPVENGFFSAAKIAVLPLAMVGVGGSGHGVFLAWVVPLALIVPGINWLVTRRVIPSARVLPVAEQATDRGPIAAFVGLDLVGTVLGQLSAAAIPLIVVAALGPANNAYFFLPYTLVTTLDLVFLGIATALTAEGSRDETRIPELFRHAVRYLVALQIPLVAVMLLFAPLVLTPFGSAYVHHGATVLRLLAGASGFRSILFLFAASARLQRRGRVLLVVEGVTAVMLAGLVIVAAHGGGVDAVATVWLAVHAAMAITVLPSLVRLMRQSPDGRSVGAPVDSTLRRSG